MTVRTSVMAAACLVLTASTAAAQTLDCASEAAALGKEESDLPRLAVASRADKPPYCITLETIMAFAGSLKAHVAHCRDSSYAASAAEWEKTRLDYARLFARARCKRTLLR
jgi:hypothetical protein